MTEVGGKSQTRLEVSTPVRYLKGVGPARAETFAQLGIETVGDLLEYFLGQREVEKCLFTPTFKRQ